MKSIGGFIQLDRFAGNEYHKTDYRFNLCRNALAYTIAEHKYVKVYLPYYICDSVTNVLDVNRIQYAFYHIGTDFRPQIDFEIKSDEAVLIVNYLGTLTDIDIEGYKSAYNNIIIDNTQAFYYLPSDTEIDYIYSTRKWFGVSDGAYLYTNRKLEHYWSLDIDHSASRMAHFLEKFENPDGDYYEAYSNTENDLDNALILRMSKLTSNIMNALDYSAYAAVRNSNYSILCQCLDEYNELHIAPKSVPFMYPLYSEKAADIRELLKQHRCFIPTLWPNVLRLDTDSFEYKCTKNILFIPCDQRYEQEDMEKICSIVKKNI